MKRYKLVKDLPTLKAGQECWISAQDDALVTRAENGKVLYLYSDKTLERFPNILEDWFEEIPDESKTVCNLELGGTYFYINEWGMTNNDVWADNTTDNQRRSIGNCFLTAEDVRKRIIYLKAKEILRQDMKGFKPSTAQDELQWYVLYNRNNGRLYVDDWDYVHFNSICFGNKEDAIASLEKHPTEWKIYLGVEE